MDVSKEKLKDYILHQLFFKDAEELEERLLDDDNLFQKYENVKKSLIESFVRKEMSETDESLFVNNFLITSENQIAVNEVRKRIESNKTDSLWQRIKAFFQNYPALAYGSVAVSAAGIVLIVILLPAIIRNLYTPQISENNPTSGTPHLSESPSIPLPGNTNSVLARESNSSMPTKKDDPIIAKDTPPFNKENGKNDKIPNDFNTKKPNIPGLPKSLIAKNTPPPSQKSLPPQQIYRSLSFDPSPEQIQNDYSTEMSTDNPGNKEIIPKDESKPYYQIRFTPFDYTLKADDTVMVEFRNKKSRFRMNCNQPGCKVSLAGNRIVVTIEKKWLKPGTAYSTHFHIQRDGKTKKPQEAPFKIQLEK
jgi:hypothetical protein